MANNKYLLTEIWRAKASWKALSETERQKYLTEKMMPLLMQMMEKGAEIIGAAVNENTSDEKMDYEYKAVWQLPDKSLSDQLEKGVKEVGFYDYFEQVNFSGHAIGAEQLIGHMIRL
ncbi:MAG: DUF6616 family protein [Bacteroidota bacterium]